jgi:ectoine hydroxylase-related dioxygenase (phytanoyl-CoA dioxygenase family)
MNTESLALYAETYARDGVVHVPGLLAADWVERLTGVVTRARADLTGRHESINPVLGATASAHADGYPTAEYSAAPGRCTIRWLWRDRPEVRAFFTDSGVAPVVAAVIGAHRLQYWFDLTFIHDPDADGAGTPWHHDIASFPCKGTQIPSLWIALTDVDADMSPLRCIAGSHRNPAMFRPPVYVDQAGELPEGYTDMPDVEARIARGEYRVLEWEIRAGDALLIHPYTLHGAPPNRSPWPRIAFSTRWAGDDVVWAPDALSMKVPRVDLGRVPVGERPAGEFFPDAIRSQEP